MGQQQTAEQLAAAAGNAGKAFKNLVQAMVDNGTPRPKAVSAVAKKNPQLREMMVAEANE